ncbi:MAG: GerMN domain-containing protein [Pedococcus sp.]
MTRRSLLGAILVLSTVVIGGCGVPGRTSAEVITAVPYDLAQGPADPDPTSRVPNSAASKVWWVRGDALVPVAAPPEGSSTLVTSRGVIDQLAGGPTEADRGRGLSTALGPDVQLSVAAVSLGRATVDIGAGDQGPSAGQLPLAVGQVVLTLTSIPGIDEVSFTAAGEPVEAPLPGGVLTGRPLTARDYAHLVGPPSTPTSAPSSASP